MSKSPKIIADDLDILGKGSSVYRMVDCKECKVEFKKYLHHPLASYGVCIDCYNDVIFPQIIKEKKR